MKLAAKLATVSGVRRTGASVDTATAAVMSPSLVAALLAGMHSCSREALSKPCASALVTPTAWCRQDSVSTVHERPGMVTNACCVLVCCTDNPVGVPV